MKQPKVTELVEVTRSFYVPHARVTMPEHDRRTGEVPPSMTKQEFVQECDINNIIKSFSKTGQIAHISSKAAQGAYVDLPDPLDYQDALHIAAAAEASFATLPSKVRDRFANDPSRFLEFMSNPDNEAEARTLGLLNPVPPSPSEPPAGPPPKAE